MADFRPESLKRITTKAQADEFIDEQMSKYYRPGVLKDLADERDPIQRPRPTFDADAVRQVLCPPYSPNAVSHDFRNPSPFFNKEQIGRAHV